MSSTTSCENTADSLSTSAVSNPVDSTIINQCNVYLDNKHSLDDNKDNRIIKKQKTFDLEAFNQLNMILKNGYRYSQCNHEVKEMFLKDIKYDKMLEDDIYNLNKDLFKEVYEKELEEFKDFYKKVGSGVRYGINIKTFNLWKKQPGVGKYYRELMNNCSILGRLLQVINERKEMSKVAVSKLYNEEKDTDELDFLYYTKKDYKKKCNDNKFYEFKFECHRKRFLYLYGFFMKFFNFNIKDVRDYNDVEHYYFYDFIYFDDKFIKRCIDYKKNELK